MLTKIEVGTKLAELAAAFGRPFGSTADRSVEVYHAALEGLTSDELAEVVSEATRTLERWPTPAQLRKMAFQIRARRPRHAGDGPKDRYHRWLGDPTDAPCPICDHPMAWTPRYTAQCDPHTHAQAGVPAIAVAADRLEEHREVWRAHHGGR